MEIYYGRLKRSRAGRLGLRSECGNHECRGRTYMSEGSSESIIDLAWASGMLAPIIQGWSVEDEETLGLHRYRHFSRNPKSISCRRVSPKGCNVNRADMASFRWKVISQMGTEIHGTTARKLTAVLTKLREAALPRRLPRGRRTSVYWCNEEIAELRRRSLKARRRYTRTR